MQKTIDPIFLFNSLFKSLSRFSAALWLIFYFFLFFSCSSPDKNEDLTEFKNNCPLSDGFNFPIGKPDAKGYYNAQKFGENNHLGDDWNGNGGGNSDLGDEVFSCAN